MSGYKKAWPGTLTDEEFERGRKVGIRRNQEDVDAGMGIGHFDSDGDGGYGVHIRGALAEFALHKFLGVDWNLPEFGADDIPGVEIRSTQKRWGDCPVRLKDKEEDVVVLVYLDMEKRAFVVIGWISVRDGKANEWREKNRGGNGLAWFVPQYYLREFESVEEARKILLTKKHVL